MSFYIKKRTAKVSLLVLALLGLGWLTSIDFWTSLKEVTTLPKEWRFQHTPELTNQEEAGKIQAHEENKEKITGSKGNKDEMMAKVEEIMAAPVKEGEEGKFFSEYRLDRDRVRDRAIELLKEVVNNHRSTAESRQEAEKKLLAITNNLSQELEIENLIKANNYQDAVIFLDRSSATVIVKAKSLANEDITKIGQLVARHAKISEQKIIIIPKQ
ncbi:MAG: SpoIIIAH-like family protein [Clostridia bacterium]|nr:SpoIIIAH-like family protein [Clostridia bacterium]